MKLYKIVFKDEKLILVESVHLTKEEIKNGTNKEIIKYLLSRVHLLNDSKYVMEKYYSDKNQNLSYIEELINQEPNLLLEKIRHQTLLENLVISTRPDFFRKILFKHKKYLKEKLLDSTDLLDSFYRFILNSCYGKGMSVIEHYALLIYILDAEYTFPNIENEINEFTDKRYIKVIDLVIKENNSKNTKMDKTLKVLKNKLIDVQKKYLEDGFRFSTNN
jgi:hypothetical protein